LTDLTGKSWMAIGETDDPNAVIESFEIAAAVIKGDPVYLSADHKVSPAAAAQDCIGIAVKSQATVGGQVSVLKRGRVKVKAGGVIYRGKAVYGADASKRVLEYLRIIDTKVSAMPQVQVQVSSRHLRTVNALIKLGKSATATEVAAVTGCARAHESMTLNELVGRGIVTKEKQGRKRIFRVKVENER
jgi:hypothetical protein